MNLTTKFSPGDKVLIPSDAKALGVCWAHVIEVMTTSKMIEEARCIEGDPNPEIENTVQWVKAVKHTSIYKCKTIHPMNMGQEKEVVESRVFANFDDYVETLKAELHE